MTVKDTGEYGNVYDFVEYRLHDMINKADADGREDIAEALYIALNAYLSGTVDIVFKRGRPFVTRRPDVDEI